MIINHENPADISYVSVYSDPDRENEVLDEEDSRLVRYCNFMEIAVLVSEIVAVLSIGLCAFVLR